MDYQSSYRKDRHSARMENLSLLMGVLAFITMCTVYPTLICGALGITFALLSRGGEMRFSPRAKYGLAISAVALGIILLMFVYTIVVANVYFGGIENMAREMYEMMGIDYDALMRSY